MTAMIPYAAYGTDDLAGAYQKCLRMVEPGDWLCNLDHDVMVCTKDWHRRIEGLLPEARKSGFGLITCSISRTANPKQYVPEGWRDVARSSDDMDDHFAIGRALVVDTPVIEEVDSGMPCFLVISRDAAKDAGLLDGEWESAAFYGSGAFLKSRIKAAGYKFGIVRSVYAYHRYNVEKDRGGMTHDAYYNSLSKEMLQQ